MTTKKKTLIKRTAKLNWNIITEFLGRLFLVSVTVWQSPLIFVPDPWGQLEKSVVSN